MVLEEHPEIKFETSIRETGVIPILQVEGEIDLSTSEDFKRAVYDMIEGGKKNIVIDLSGVGFMDSTGLGVLVGALKKTRMLGGTVRLICNNDTILKTFTLTGLDKVFLIYNNLRECLAE
jgi:anti-sigma B factor antagonist